MFTPVTKARPSRGKTSRTCALRPLSLPLMTITWSFFLILFTGLVHLGCERNDLHVIALAKLSCNGTKDTRAARILLVTEDDRCIVVEADVGAVRSSVLLRRPNDNRSHDVSLFHGGARLGQLHGRNNRVTDPRIATPSSAGHENAHDLSGAGV